MSARVKPIAMQILGKEYNIACTPEEQETLLLSANRLDREMRILRDTGKINGGERIAVMVSLNIMHEFQLLQEKREAPEQEFAVKISKLSEKVENVLDN